MEKRLKKNVRKKTLVEILCQKVNQNIKLLFCEYSKHVTGLVSVLAEVA